MYPAHGDDQDSEDLQYTRYNQYSQAGYSRSVQGSAGPRQQPTYGGTPYTSQQTGVEDWQGSNYSYQEQDPRWNSDLSSYTASTIATANSIPSWNQVPSEYVPDDAYRSSIQDNDAEVRQYALGSEMGSATGRTSRAYASHPGDWGSTYQTAVGYSQYPQTRQGMYGYQNQAPQLLVHPPQENNLGSVASSRDAQGYIEESPFAISATGSPMLSPYGQAAGDEVEFSSENSQSPDGQLPPSPDAAGASDSADPKRKWACREEECVERKPFKRHADLMRHMTTVHHKDGMEKFDCPRRGCPRKGDNGFTRNDHLREHLRNFHLQDIPKRKGGARGKGRVK